MIDSIARWLNGTSVASAVLNISWIWPACETLHFLGMALLFGVAGLLDLRMLGFLKMLPVASLQRLLPWAVLGFVINLVTGILFLSPAAASTYLHNLGFQLKLAFILIAGVNALLFYMTGLSVRVDAVGPGEDAPPAAKLVAATSLFLWAGVIYWGRLLPWTGPGY